MEPKRFVRALYAIHVAWPFMPRTVDDDRLGSEAFLSLERGALIYVRGLRVLTHHEGERDGEDGRRHQLFVTGAFFLKADAFTCACVLCLLLVGEARVVHPFFGDGINTLFCLVRRKSCEVKKIAHTGALHNPDVRRR